MTCMQAVVTVEFYCKLTLVLYEVTCGHQSMQGMWNFVSHAQILWHWTLSPSVLKSQKIWFEFLFHMNIFQLRVRACVRVALSISNLMSVLGRQLHTSLRQSDMYHFRLVIQPIQIVTKIFYLGIVSIAQCETCLTAVSWSTNYYLLSKCVTQWYNHAMWHCIWHLVKKWQKRWVGHWTMILVWCHDVCYCFSWPDSVIGNFISTVCLTC